jgi:hypothetical protein
MKRHVLLADLLLSSKDIRFILSRFCKLGVRSLNLFNVFVSYVLQRGQVHPNSALQVFPVNNFIKYIERVTWR